jgi:hypothetical protein
MGISKVAETFFAASTVERKTLYSEIARRNLVSNRMPRSSRYANLDKDCGKYVEDLKDVRQDSGGDGNGIEEADGEDSPMADV